MRYIFVLWLFSVFASYSTVRNIRISGRTDSLDSILTGNSAKMWLLIVHKVDSLDTVFKRQCLTFILKDHTGFVSTNALETPQISEKFSWAIIYDRITRANLLLRSYQKGVVDTAEIEMVKSIDSLHRSEEPKFLRVIEYDGPRSKLSTPRKSFFYEPS